jgi:hypothetical protein
MTHRSMRGKIVDMEKLTKQNELMPAVGNMRVNARGDQLGEGGKIIKKREEIVAEYYKDTTSDVNPNKGEK